MSHAMVFYITTLLVYGGVDVLACLGLSLEYGIAGVANFGFIVFQAAGAYTAAILSLPPDSANGGFQQYAGGLGLPFPLPWIAATLVGALVAVPFAGLMGRKLRHDNLAIALLITAVIANTVVTNFQPLFNGDAGLALVPAPLGVLADPQSDGYQWLFSVVTIALCVVVYIIIRRLTESPYGRSLRAVRDNDLAAEAVGKDVRGLRTSAVIVGGAVAGLSGAVLVGFINVWAPSAWEYQETVVLIAAVIVGGLGNNIGAILGAILVPLGFAEATRFIPPFGPPGLVPALEWVAIGALVLLFLWFRPSGVVPERRRVIASTAGPYSIASADLSDADR